MIKAKKRFGQNFLKDESILQKIIQAMPKERQSVVEIGPGLGDLTKWLLQKCESVTAFEIDLELCGFLQDRFLSEIEKEQLVLVCGDVLDRWSEGSLLDQKYHLVANLPYYIATNLILRALDDKMCQSVTVMVQKEVAKKFASKVGERDFCALSILTDSIAKAEVLFDVSPECFEPPPKVTSSILRLTKQSEYLSLFSDEKEVKSFKSFLKVAFSAPRKGLLKNLGCSFSKERVTECFEDLNIAKNIRPHQLPSEKYHLLFKKLK